MTRRVPKRPVHRERRHGKYSDAIMDLYDGRCDLCGKDGADTIDHRVPVAWGGSDHPLNLVPAHRSCNSSKGADRPPRASWGHPLMWQPGFGGRVEGTVKVPHWNYAGLRTMMLFAVFGEIAWLVWGRAAGFPWWTGLLSVLIPLLWNGVLLWWWRRECRKVTRIAHSDMEIEDPQEWIADALQRKRNRD